MSNLLILSNLALSLLDRQAQIAGVLNKAHSEGRDVTDAELASLFAADADARTQLQAEIDRQRAAPGTLPG